MARIVSVNVGKVAGLPWNGGQVLSGFVKRSVAGPVRVADHHLEGDEQGDRTVHGGPRKAVYLYSADHYDWWRSELPGVELPWGSFGENLTVSGIREPDVHIGDRWRAGTAVLEVTQPRSPCFKMNARFARADMIPRFWQSRRSGFYLRIVTEGVVARGDAFDRTHEAADAPTVSDEVERRYRATLDP